jgi:hypothetical protein
MIKTMTQEEADDFLTDYLARLRKRVPRPVVLGSRSFLKS